MHNFIKLLFIFCLIVCNVSKGAEKIVFVDIDAIINQSDIGKKLNKQLNDSFKKEDKNITELEKKLKEQEDNILKQKNILSEDELNKKIQNLRNDIASFQKKKLEITENFRKKKLDQTNKLVSKLNSILSAFAEQNEISIIIQKQNIVIGKSALDITKNIMEIFNKEVTSIN